MNLIIQYANSECVLSFDASHCSSLSTLSRNSWVLTWLGHWHRWFAHPFCFQQLRHWSSSEHPTLFILHTVAQKLECFLLSQIWYRTSFLAKTLSNQSQPTESNWGSVHLCFRVRNSLALYLLNQYCSAFVGSNVIFSWPRNMAICSFDRVPEAPCGATRLCSWHKQLRT